MISFQLSHTPPSTPGQSSQSQNNHHWSLGAGEVTLEHGGWALRICHLRYHLDRGVMWITAVTRPTHIYCVILPLPSLGGLMSSHAPSQPPAWLSRNIAPPSPAYCDGCQRWGNLLSVTGKPDQSLLDQHHHLTILKNLYQTNKLETCF